MTTTYVADVTVFDGRRVRRRQGVLIDGDRIGWVGPHARAPRRFADADETIEGAGRTLTPGLIDCHVHLSFDGSADFAAEARELDPAVGAIKGVVNARRHLAAGVTTVRDLGGLGITRLARAVERGVVAGPRILAAGRALTVTGGHGHGLGLAREVDGPGELRRAVREECREGAAVIKLMATGGVLTPGIDATSTAFTDEELRAAVEEAHARGRRVAAHAIGAAGVERAVRAGVDSVEHCVQVTDAAVREMVERGTFRSPTLSALLGIVSNADRVPAYAVEKAAAILDDARRTHRRCLRAGIRHVCGTDAGTPFNPHGNAPRELVAMVEWGMRSLDALAAATANGAELLGLPEIGTIEEGKLADLVLYEGDPVEDISVVLRPRAVWRAVPEN
ncbi:MAG: hydrolase [Actinomycetota bacterium]|jgi:imidazolonepropionase-like amidohydrolase|nr:MAG: hydrolase [Actinomycetota bacterium]